MSNNYNNWNKNDLRFYGIICALLGFVIGFIMTVFIYEIKKYI